MNITSKNKQDLLRSAGYSMFFAVLLLACDSVLLWKRLKSIFGTAVSLDPEQNLMMSGFWHIAFYHGILVITVALFTFIFTQTFRIKRHILFYSFLVLYIFTFALVRYPQLFHATGVNDILPSERGLIFSLFVGFMAIAAIVGVLLLLKREYVQFASSLRKKSLLGVSALSFLFIGTNVHSLFFQNVSSSQASSFEEAAETKNKKIIVISVDALNADTDTMLLQYANESLRKFLNNSQKSPRTIADATQTHGSMVSLFSGKRPYETGVRYPFHPISGNKGQDTFATLKEIKNQGYKITFLRDEMVTASFLAGEVIDKVVMPKSEETLNKFSYFYSSFLTYGIFDNFIGHALFPEAYGSMAFNFGNQLDITASKFNREIARINSSTQNEFLFFHTCVLHAPLNLPFPYYPAKGEGQLDGIRYSYLSPLKQWKLEQRAAVQAETSFNAKVYQAGLRFVTEQLLNPVFSELDKNGYLKTATVFLVSDHGENLWSEHGKLVGNITVPYHGDTMLFGSKNEFAYFRVLNEQGVDANADLEKEINLSQIFRKSLGMSFDAATVYSESAYLPLPGSYSQPRYLDYFAVQKSLVVNETPVYMVANDNLLNPAMMQKQKSVFYGDYKLTIYPTLAGQELFLCNYKTDPLCLKNALSFPEAQASKVTLLAQLKVANAHDVQANAPTANEWLRFRDAETLYFRDHDFAAAHLRIENIWKSSNDSELKRLIARTLNRRCHLLPAQTQVFWQSISGQDQNLKASFERCMADAQSYQAVDGGFAGVAWKYDHQDALKQFFNLPKAWQFLDNLKTKYALGNVATVTGIFQALPPEARASEAQMFLALIKDQLEYFFNYKLREDQDIYYFLKFYISQAVNKEVDAEILHEIIEKPTSLEFEFRFITYLERKNHLEPKGLRDERLSRLSGFLK